MLGWLAVVLWSIGIAAAVSEGNAHPRDRAVFTFIGVACCVAAMCVTVAVVLRALGV
jgi:hypothetical protein